MHRQWDHLTEEINYEKAVREQKLQAELSSAKRERDFYLSRVDRAKAQAAMEQRRGAKGEEGGGGEGGASGVAAAASAAGGGGGGKEGGGAEGAAAAAAAGGDDDRRRAVRHYGQRRVKPDPVTALDAPRVGDDVLGMVVASKRRKVAG